LSYAQDLMNHAVQGMGLLDLWLGLAALMMMGVLWMPRSS
jgi:hypothetical protein